MRTKSLVMVILAMLISASTIASAQKFELTGRIIDSDQKAIPYATVVVLSGTDQVAGGSTNDEGRFSLSVESGNYTFNAR